MNSETDNPMIPARLIHEILNDISTIMSISQLATINHKELPSELQTDLKRIVKTARHISTQVKGLADILPEED